MAVLKELILTVSLTVSTLGVFLLCECVLVLKVILTLSTFGLEQN